MRVYKLVWTLLGVIKDQTPKGTCPLCGYVAVTTKVHYCEIAHANVFWEETDGRD